MVGDFPCSGGPVSLLVQEGFPCTFPLPPISYPVVAGFIGISVGIELQFHHYVQKTGWLFLAQINVLSSLCPGDWNGISKWVMCMESQQAGAVKAGQKRTAFEYATEYQDQRREFGHGIQKKQKLLLFEDRHNAATFL